MLKYLFYNACKGPFYVSRATKKPVFGGLRPGKTQTSLLISLEVLNSARIGIIILYQQQTTKVRIRLQGCAC